ncbi:MAG: SLC13 family permease, partial [Candidatus Aminicenantaceae bacterium]
MSTLQNIIILTISFLLSRVFIDSDIHKQFLGPEWSKTTNVNTSIVSAVLFASYCLSLVFSNTIVVLSFIPIIRHILSKIKDSQIKRFFSTQLILALIYGANIGGMGSLTGSPQNLIFIGSVEILKVPGRDNINYFTWLIIGIPATLGLLFISRLILKIGETKYLHEQPLQFWQKTIKKVKVRKHLYFIGGNILLIIILTALQFLTKPQPLYSGLNIIDIIFIFYFLVFIFTNLIYPREERTFKSGLKNFVFMFLFIILFPFIFICEAIREIGARLQMNNLKIVCTMESTVHSIYSRLWFFLFKEKTDDLRMKNKNVYVSINRMIYDLPFFGIILMGM